MSTKNNPSVQNFVEELKKRRDIIISSSNLNLNTNSFTSLKNLISSCFSKDIHAVNITDIELVNSDDLRQILKLIGESEQNIDMYLATLSNPLVCERIKNNITKYIDEYESIELSQQEMQKSKIELYDKYINLFTSELPTYLFEDFEELKKLTFNLGISKDEEKDLLMYIADLNNHYMQAITPNPSLLAKIISLTSQYCNPDSSVFNSILEILTHKDVDLELIPEISIELKDALRIPTSLASNTICSIILSNLYSDLSNNPEYEELINQVLGYTYSRNDIILETANNILKESIDLSSKTVFQGNDGMQYIDSTIQDIMNEENLTYNQAVDCKTIALIKIIAETIDKSETIDPDSEEYNSAMSLLDELNESYLNIVSKKKINRVVGYKKSAKAEMGKAKAA